MENISHLTMDNKQKKIIKQVLQQRQEKRYTTSEKLIKNVYQKKELLQETEEHCRKTLCP